MDDERNGCEIAGIFAEQLRDLIDSAPAAMVLYEAAYPYRVMASNKIYNSMWQEPLPLQGLVGVALTDYVPQVEESGILDIFNRVAGSGESATLYEFPYDGLERGLTWWNWNLYPIFSEGKIIALGHIAVDVTEQVVARKMIEESESRIRENNRRLELLADTASQLLMTDDPQNLIQSLCENVMEKLECHAFFNYLVNEERDCLHLNAVAGITPEVVRSIEWLDYGVAVCGCAARDGHRIVAEDIFNTPDPRTDLVKSFGIQAYACNPLLASGGAVIGTLSFGSKTKIRFTDDELFLMKAVADILNMRRLPPAVRP